MILYHGSYTAIREPDLAFSRLRTDFGRGFYLTPLKTQAVNWSRRFLRVHSKAVVSSYRFLSRPDDKLAENFNVLAFDAYNLAWLNSITACRLGRPVDTEWDLVIGGVANDKVFDSLQLYFDNLIGPDDAIGRLQYSKPNIQYCFKTQSLIDEYLQFVDAEVIE